MKLQLRHPFKKKQTMAKEFGGEPGKPQRQIGSCLGVGKLGTIFRCLRIYIKLQVFILS